MEKRLRRRRGRSRRGLSEIISVVLMILIVVAVAVAVMAFATTGLGSLASGFSSLLSGEGNSIAQQLSVEQITYQYSSGLGPYVPIIISNSQTGATSAPFQQMVTIDPALYTALEATDLGNIRFYSSIAGGVFSGELYSWLESYSGSTTPNTATSALFWVQLPTGISASGSFTAYMSFQSTSVEFDGAFAGEAPSLSPVYGQYDNGANVFFAYFNGNTPTTSFSVLSGYTLTQATGVAYTSGTINALNLQGYKSGNAILSFNTALPNEQMIAESSVQDSGASSPGTDTGHAGFVDNAAAASVANAIGVQSGYGKSYFNLDYINSGTFSADNAKGGSAVTSWTYSAINYTGPSGTTFSGYNAPQLYSTSGGYSGSVNINPLSGASNLYLGLVADTTSSYTVNVYFNWMRARAAPPNGVMPGETTGQLTTTPQAGANLYVRNTGSSAATLSAVYVQNETANTFVESYQISPAETLQPGSFVELNIPFVPWHGETYSFSISTSIGYSVEASAPA